jgi:hypothetical protein
LVHAQELASLAEAAQTARKDELAGTFLQRALEGFETVRSTRNYPPSWLGRYLVDARSRVGDFEGAEAVVRAIGEERERAELLGDLAMHVAHRAGGGLVALEGLLDRHPGVLEQIAIRLHGAQGFLLRAQARSAEHAPPASSRQGSSRTP